MSLDLNLIAAIVHSGDVLSFHQHDLALSDLHGPEEKQLWSFIEKHWEENRAAPSAELIEEKFGIKLNKSKENLSYWISEVKKRKLFDEMNELFVGIQENLNKGDVSKSYEIIRDFVKGEEKKLSTLEGSVKTIGELADPVWQRYLDAKAGKFGIYTPWEKLNSWSRGWWPKDMSFVVGRSGTGKSWVALHIAAAAHDPGAYHPHLKHLPKNKVLIISCEMSTEDMASRYFSLKYRKQYGALRSGRLSTFEEKALVQEMEEFKKDPLSQGVIIMDGSGGMGSADVERSIEKCASQNDLKLVVMDSVYRIKPRQKVRDRFEGMSYVADEIKTFAQIYGVPIVATTQLNRDSTKKKSGAMGQEDIAMSDVINWNSTNVLGLQQSDEDREAKVMNIHPIKVREGENQGKPLAIHWDFTTMNFAEKGIENSTTKDEDWNF